MKATLTPWPVPAFLFEAPMARHRHEPVDRYCGFVAIFAIEVRELPDVDEPVVNVRQFPGASPETMDAKSLVFLKVRSRVSGVKEELEQREGNTRGPRRLT